MIRINPQYRIRNDMHCSYIVKVSAMVDHRVQPWNYSIQEVPPILGSILSAFDGREISTVIKELSSHYSLSESLIRGFISQITENPNVMKIVWENEIIYFPPYFLTESDSQVSTHYTVEDFSPQLPFLHLRPSSPINLNIMVTSRCKTDCIYCYADRNCRDELPLQDILRILDEAHSCGVINITLTGGDILAHPYWKMIIKKAYEYGYRPFISTKIPLDRDEVSFLINLGIRQIQFSLDSGHHHTLKQLIQCGKDYLEKSLQMFEHCDELGLKLSIRSVLTRFNSSSEALHELHRTLNRYKCIQSWTITPAFYSEYKRGFENYYLDKKALEASKIIIDSFESQFPIYYSFIQNRLISLTRGAHANLNEFLSKNKLCSANSYSISILANGDVSICEMLYHNPTFLLGSIHHDSLKNIWNNRRAIELYNGIIYKDEHKQSPCFSCACKKICKGSNSKKVCYVDIVKSYSNDKYDYPDPMCPFAIGVDYSKMM